MSLLLVLGVIFTAKGSSITDDPEPALKVLGYGGIILGGVLLTIFANGVA